MPPDNVGMLPSGGLGPPAPPMIVGVALGGTVVDVEVGVKVGPPGVMV